MWVWVWVELWEGMWDKMGKTTGIMTTLTLFSLGWYSVSGIFESLVNQLLVLISRKPDNNTDNVGDL